MEILVKKNNKLLNLGEGRIFSKRHLRLNEVTQGQDAEIQVNATDPNAAKQIDDLVKNTPEPQRQNYRLKIVNGQQSNANKTDNAHTSSLKGATNGSNVISQSRHSFGENPSNGATSVSLDDVNPKESGNINSSVTPRKVLDELRKNSIPFTKKELHNFLREI